MAYPEFLLSMSGSWSAPISSCLFDRMPNRFVSCISVNGQYKTILMWPTPNDQAALECGHGQILQKFTNLTNVEEVLEYYVHCSLSRSCVDLAKGLLFLANKGHCLWTSQQVLTRRQTSSVKAQMVTCRTCDAAGDIAFTVGLPGISGVGGRIVGVIPSW